MQESSSDEQANIYQNFIVDANDSLNETAISNNPGGNDIQVQDQDNFAQEVLKQFYQSQLRIQVDMRFDQLQKDQKVFKNGIIGIYPPQPLVYFLPYTILVDVRQKLPDIRDKIRDKYKERIQNKEISLNMYVDNKDQLFISLHTNAELIFYKIRRVSVNSTFHKYIDCLDKDILVDRLFNFYKSAYKKFYFEEISVFFMYWAYIKNFLKEDYLSPSAIKMLIICLFLSSGLGIQNVLTSFQKKFWDQQKKCLNMATTNRKGQCNISPDILKYQNYSIQQKKGLYIVSQKKYQIIRLIEPALYPIGKRNQQMPYKFEYRKQEISYFQSQANKLHKKLIQMQGRNKIKITRYHLLFLLMTKAQSYFNHPNKLIFDIKRKNILFQETSNEFLLQIQHPVFSQVVGKQLAENGSTARRIKGELNQLIKQVKDNQKAIDNVACLFTKK